MNLISKWHFDDSVCEITPKKIEDQRGFFSEVYRMDIYKDLGINEGFIQENHSFSKHKYTFRGLHLQKAPYEQAKLIRVVNGSILDIAIDLRLGSPTYLEHRFFDLSAKNFKQLYLPIGFAHGFLTLEDNTEITYKVSNKYEPSSDVTLSIFDKDLGINLPCNLEEMLLSDKDQNGKSLKALGKVFE
jgi:dTDP-4-dehydrorhamnose 3,5-epimerase